MSFARAFNLATTRLGIADKACPKCAQSQCVSKGYGAELCCRVNQEMHEPPARKFGYSPTQEASYVARLADSVREIQAAYSRYLHTQSGSVKTITGNNKPVVIEPKALCLLKEALGVRGVKTRDELLMRSYGKNYLESQDNPEVSMICYRLMRHGLLFQGRNEHTWHATSAGMSKVIGELR